MGKKKSRPSGNVVEVTKILDDDLSGEDLVKTDANADPAAEHNKNESEVSFSSDAEAYKTNMADNSGETPATQSEESIQPVNTSETYSNANLNETVNLSDGTEENPTDEINMAEKTDSDNGNETSEIPLGKRGLFGRRRKSKPSGDVVAVTKLLDEDVERITESETSMPANAETEKTIKAPLADSITEETNVITRKERRRQERESKRNAECSESEIPEGKKKKKHKVLLIIIIIVAAILVAIYVAGIVIGNYYFYPNTYINEVNVSWMDAEESNTALLPKDDVFTVVTRTGVETINLADIDYEIHLIHSTDDLIHDQDVFAWPTYFFKDTIINDAYRNSYNLPVLRDTVAKLDACQTEKMVKPTDAYIELGKDGHYSIIEATEGTQLDVGLATSAIVNALNGGLYTVNLDEKGCYVKPKKYSNDPELNLTLDTLKALGEETITIDVTGTTEVLDPYALMDFITYDAAKKTITVKEDKLNEYVANLAAKYNTLYTTRTFITHSGNQISVGGGNDNYGFLMDQPATINALRDAILAKKTQTITPVWTKKGWSRGVKNGDIGVTYIEISIAEQTMWYYKDNQLFLETPVVTGFPDGRRDTPTGVFNAWAMSTNTRLTGTFDGSSWDCVVNYWISVDNNGVGIHDATWQPYFGGDRYKVGGSHGCINTPLGAMGTLYNNLIQTTPIVIY